MAKFYTKNGYKRIAEMPKIKRDVNILKACSKVLITDGYNR